MELRDYLRIARRRWMTIAIVTLLTLGGVAVFTLRTAPQYASSARLFISTPESSSDQAYTGGLFSQARVTSYADLLTGEEISRRVVERLNLDEPVRSRRPPSLKPSSCRSPSPTPVPSVRSS